MTWTKHFAGIGFAIACAAASGAHAQEIVRIPGGNPVTSAVVAVPPGYTTYYIGGTTAGVTNPGAPKGSLESYGDIGAQTRSALDNLKATLAKAGLTFADVVEAHVFMAPDPGKNGDIDVGAMNKVWGTEFGTAAQPNRPARATFKVAALAGSGRLVEIEMIAAKKVAAK